MQKILQEKELNIYNKRRFLVRILFVFVAVLFTLQITISGILATSGDQLSRLEQRYSSLVFENENLSQSISAETSLSKISQEASTYGFAKSKSVIYMPEQTSVALGL